jgi:hypothetical protein
MSMPIQRDCGIDAGCFLFIFLFISLYSQSTYAGRLHAKLEINSFYCNTDLLVGVGVILLNSLPAGLLE